jgi:DNA mismatch repair protein MutS
MPKDDVTPIRKQYLDIKRQYPNAILFFRLGDFYETFDEDAEITARELDIVLTSRPVGQGIGRRWRASPTMPLKITWRA